MSYSIDNNGIGLSIHTGRESFSRNLNKTMSQQYFSYHSHKSISNTFENHLPPEPRHLSYHDSQFLNSKAQHTFNDSGQLQKQNLERNRSFNTSVISQHLSSITKAFKLLQQQELNSEAVRKFNRMRRLLEIVHKFVVEEKLCDPERHHRCEREQQLPKMQSQPKLTEVAIKRFSQQEVQVDLCSIGKSNKETDIGPQCFFNDDELTDLKQQQDKKKVKVVEVDGNKEQQMMIDKLIGLSVKSLNLSVHVLNMKSFENHQIVQVGQVCDKRAINNYGSSNNQDNCCKNHMALQQLTNMNPSDKSCMKRSKLSSKVKSPEMANISQSMSRDQLHSQLTEIKTQMRQFAVKDEDKDKENVNKANSGKGKIKVKRKLFTVQEGVHYECSKESTMQKMRKLQTLYRQTKDIYREYQRSMVGNGN